MRDQALQVELRVIINKKGAKLRSWGRQNCLGRNQPGWDEWSRVKGSEWGQGRGLQGLCQRVKSLISAIWGDVQPWSNLHSR